MTDQEKAAGEVDDFSQAMHAVRVETTGPGFTLVTSLIQDWLAEIGARDGLLTLFIRHTSASLTIQENADPDVLADLEDALLRFAPEDAPYRHTIEGPDDMPSHIRAMLTATSLSIPVLGGRAALGTWQGIYLIEHRARPHVRELALHYLGSLRGKS